MKINHLLSGADYSRQVPAVFRKLKFLLGFGASLGQMFVGMWADVTDLRLKGSNDFKDLKGAVVSQTFFAPCCQEE